MFFADSCTVKVGDFGFSTQIASRDELLSTFCGSPPYAAPELFRDESYRGPYVDYWALGVLLYFIVTATMPFRAQTIVSLKKLIIDCRYDIPTFVSVECCQLIAGFLQSDPLKRYNLEHARATRWLRSLKPVTSVPKFDLKSSFVNLLKHRKAGQEEAIKANKASLVHSMTLTSMGIGVANQPKQTEARLSLNLEHMPKLSFYNSPNEDNTRITKQLNENAKVKVSRLSDVEKETFRRMMILGIDEAIITEHLEKGSSSHVVGTFRILVNKVMRDIKERVASPVSSIDEEKSRNRRSTAFHANALERLWAQYGIKSNGSAKLTPPNNRKCEERKEKTTENSKHKTILTVRSNNSGNTESKKSKLSKIFSNDSGKAVVENGSNKSSSRKSSKASSGSKEIATRDTPSPNQDKKDTESTQKSITPPPALPAPPSSLLTTKAPEAVNGSIPEEKKKETEDTLKVPSNHSRKLSFSRSLRTLRNLMTENNICGTNSVTENAIQTIDTTKCNGNSSPAPEKRDQTEVTNESEQPEKNHVIHKTATMHIAPRNCAATILLTPSKLHRSQTTPNVSTCYYRQQNGSLKTKKSFANPNRCVIV